MHVSQWDTCWLQENHGSPQTPAVKQPTLAESCNNCVPYDKKVARWTAFMGAVTLHIVKDMVPVYAVEKPEVHPQAENVRLQVCATKPQWVLTSVVTIPTFWHRYQYQHVF